MALLMISKDTPRYYNTIFVQTEISGMGQGQFTSN